MPDRPFTPVPGRRAVLAGAAAFAAVSATPRVALACYACDNEQPTRQRRTDRESPSRIIALATLAYIRTLERSLDPAIARFNRRLSAALRQIRAEMDSYDVQSRKARRALAARGVKVTNWSDLKIETPPSVARLKEEMAAARARRRRVRQEANRLLRGKPPTAAEKARAQKTIAANDRRVKAARRKVEKGLLDLNDVMLSPPRPVGVTTTDANGTYMFSTIVTDPVDSRDPGQLLRAVERKRRAWKRDIERRMRLLDRIARDVARAARTIRPTGVLKGL